MLHLSTPHLFLNPPFQSRAIREIAMIFNDQNEKLYKQKSSHSYQIYYIASLHIAHSHAMRCMEIESKSEITQFAEMENTRRANSMFHYLDIDTWKKCVHESYFAIKDHHHRVARVIGRSLLLHFYFTHTAYVPSISPLFFTLK